MKIITGFFFVLFVCSLHMEQAIAGRSMSVPPPSRSGRSVNVPPLSGCARSSLFSAREVSPFHVVVRNILESPLSSKPAPWQHEFGKIQMVELPGVTESDLEELWAEGIETSIRSPMPRFKISDTVIPVGLYFTVMGRYPDLYKSYFPIASRRATQQRRWELYPDLPLTNTTVAEDQEFVFRLNLKTHRRFYIPNEQQVEYAIRGRSLREEGGFGSIIPTEFYFPGDEDDLPHHAWIASNSGYETHEVRAPLPSLPLENSTNTFGLIHPIGNVFVRSAEGVLRGGSFSHGNGYTRSSKRVAGFAEERERSIGLRIAEDF